mgnify:CR=1 FL=1|tara:strand:+ start:2850 stop:3260 length:411 start_codon:yes stop_codon:yes gene_type:complete
MKPKYKIRDWLIKPEDMGIDITKVYPIDLTAKKGWKGERQYGWKMTEIHKKIKHLNHTMIMWVENNRLKGGNIEGHGDLTDWWPARPLGGGLSTNHEDDFKIVQKLDRLLSEGRKLTKKELQYCNEMYIFYAQKNT